MYIHVHVQPGRHPLTAVLSLSLSLFLCSSCAKIQSSSPSPLKGERATPTSHRYTVCTPCTVCIHVHVYLHVLYMYTPVWEIGGRQVAQATCKRSVAIYFDQLVAIPGDLRICSCTLRYSHTTTHIARPYTFR